MLCWLYGAGRGPEPAGRRRRRRLGRRPPRSVAGWSARPPPPSAAPGCTSRSTPGSPATARPSAAGTSSAPRPRRPRRRGRAGAWWPLVAPGRRRRAGPPVGRAAARGVRPRVRRAPGWPAWSRELRHLANSAGALVVPEARFDLVRVGIASYGVEPAPGLAARPGVVLRPAMTLRAQLAQVKDLAAGAGVSYGWTWVADRPATGRPGAARLRRRGAAARRATWPRCRSAAGRAPVRGRVCMDQLVVELGPGPAASRRRGRPLRAGRPTASRRRPTGPGWCGTIGYEIVTRVGARVPRRYRDAAADGRRPRASAGRRGLRPVRRRRPPRAGPAGGSAAATAARTPGRLARAPVCWPALAALAAGGVAAGLELERRLVRRADRRAARGRGAARRGGAALLLAARARSRRASPRRRRAAHRGRRGAADAARRTTSTLVLVHGYALSLDCWHFQRLHFRGRVRQVLYDQRSHGRSGPLRRRPLPRPAAGGGPAPGARRR